MHHHPLIRGRRRGPWCQPYPCLRRATSSTAPSLKRPWPVVFSVSRVSLFSSLASLASLFPPSRPAVVSSRSRLSCLVLRSFPLSPLRSGGILYSHHFHAVDTGDPVQAHWRHKSSVSLWIALVLLLVKTQQKSSQHHKIAITSNNTAKRTKPQTFLSYSFST